MVLAVLGDCRQQTGMGLADARVHHEQNARRLGRDGARRGLQHERVRGREDVPAEIDGISEGDPDFVFQDIHIEFASTPNLQLPRLRAPDKHARYGEASP
jgi:hypothetical protein